MNNPVFWAIYDKDRLPIRYFLSKTNCLRAYKTEYSKNSGMYYGEYRVPVEDSE